MKNICINIAARTALNVSNSEYALLYIVHWHCIHDEAPDKIGWTALEKRNIAHFLGMKIRGTFKMISKLEDLQLLERDEYFTRITTKCYHVFAKNNVKFPDAQSTSGVNFGPIQKSGQVSKVHSQNRPLEPNLADSENPDALSADQSAIYKNNIKSNIDKNSSSNSKYSSGQQLNLVHPEGGPMYDNKYSPLDEPKHPIIEWLIKENHQGLLRWCEKIAKSKEHSHNLENAAWKRVVNTPTFPNEEAPLGNDDRVYIKNVLEDMENNIKAVQKKYVSPPRTMLSWVKRAKQTANRQKNNTYNYA